MSTKLTDIVTPENMASYTNERSVKVTRLWRSGAVFTDGTIQAMANSGGVTVQLPFWKDIGTPDPNLSSDNNNKAVPLTVSAAKQVARICQLNQAWGAMDLAVEVAGSDPLVAVNEKTNDYWAEVFQKRAVASIAGVIADSVANHDSDLVVNGAGTWDAGEFIDAQDTMGDHADKLSVLIMHSKIRGVLAKGDLITYERDSSSNARISYYQGYPIIVDDEMTVEGTGADAVYTTLILGEKVIAAASGTPKVPLEAERSALDGDGGGSEVLVSRVSPIIHPVGYAWNEGTIAGAQPTAAELADASHWTRVVSNRKSVPFAAYKCKAA